MPKDPELDEEELEMMRLAAERKCEAEKRSLRKQLQRIKADYEEKDYALKDRQRKIDVELAGITAQVSRWQCPCESILMILFSSVESYCARGRLLFAGENPKAPS